MMNIYNGNVVTGPSGAAIVTLPDWVASKIANGQFTIKTDKPGVEVFWQVTGIRQDAGANAHRIPLEVEKSATDQGHCLHPELFGHDGESGILQSITHSRARWSGRRASHRPCYSRRG